MDQGRAHYDLDASVLEQLQLSTFQVRDTVYCTVSVSKLALQSKFDVKDFVGAISEKLITQSNANAGREASSFISLAIGSQ